MSELIVLGYDSEEKAQQVYEELGRLQKDLIIQLDTAAVVSRDTEGKLHTKTEDHLVAGGALGGMFWGMLFGLLFLVPFAGMVIGGALGAVFGGIGHMGIDDQFKKQVQDLLQPGTSAVFMIVSKVTPDKAIDALRPYGGTVLKTSLPEDVEKKLMTELVGEQPAAGTPEA
jgi:uncharacterized membrane protein